MKKESITIEDLIAGGLIGASLGALIVKNKEEGATIGAIAGAALFATLNANQQAKKSNLPIVFEEDGIIYKEENGKKIVLKKIDKPSFDLKKKYKLK